VGQTVAVLFVDGNPHSGVYMGPIHNLLNPHGAVDTLMVQVGSAQILMAPDGAIAVIGTDINIQADNVAINGKQVATVGAPDTRGDNLTARGW
jgi:hypothetical protein